MSGNVRIEFAQKFAYPTPHVVTRRTRQQPDDRYQRPALHPAFTVLVDAMPLTPALLARLRLDPFVRRNVTCRSC